MAVHQVEEYYLFMSGLTLTEDSKTKIEELFSDEGWSNYEFQDSDSALVVDDIPDEMSGEALEAEIRELLE